MIEIIEGNTPADINNIGNTRIVPPIILFRIATIVIGSEIMTCFFKYYYSDCLLSNIHTF
jgi:hypothetical protein